MTKKLIMYQLDNSRRDFPLISKAIKTFPEWAKIMDRVWIIRTSKSASDVRTILTQTIGSRGKIFVIDILSGSWGSYAVDKTVTEWLKNNLNR